MEVHLSLARANFGSHRLPYAPPFLIRNNNVDKSLSVAEESPSVAEESPSVADYIIAHQWHSPSVAQEPISGKRAHQWQKPISGIEAHQWQRAHQWPKAHQWQINIQPVSGRAQQWQEEPISGIRNSPSVA